MKITKSKKVIFSVAIAFVAVFFFAYAIQAFYPAPQYNDFCKVDVSPVYVDNEAQCVQSGGKWTDYSGPKESSPTGGYCDMNYYCSQDYDAARKPYERNVFFANIIIGLVLFLVAFFLGLESVSSGLMGGGVMMLVYGSIRYWDELSDVWRTLMLGVTLAILIWLGYRKLKE